MVAVLAILLTAASGVRGEGDVQPPAVELATVEQAGPVVAPPGRTWGQAGIYGYADGSKMAPNGVPYDPLFALDLLLNISLTSDRSLYLYSDSRFWTQRFVDGIAHGPFDFSKRQFDLDAGAAYNYVGPFEARAFAYCYNNINRGDSPFLPVGYVDGVGVENRYYLESTNFDAGLYRFLSLGYYFTKDMIDADGKTFRPSLFARASLALDVWPEQLYLYSDVTCIAHRPVVPKLLLGDLGVAVRPFTQVPDLEFRVGADNNWDVQVRRLRTLLYGNVRFVW
jgi:hypothetical protein